MSVLVCVTAHNYWQLILYRDTPEFADKDLMLMDKLKSTCSPSMSPFRCFFTHGHGVEWKE